MSSLRRRRCCCECRFCFLRLLLLLLLLPQLSAALVNRRRRLEVMAPPGVSPPRHRHDGTSPLPLGMDASPAPVRWVCRQFCSARGTDACMHQASVSCRVSCPALSWYCARFANFRNYVSSCRVLFSRSVGGGMWWNAAAEVLKHVEMGLGAE